MARNSDIRTVQTALALLGHNPGSADGWWGIRTATAAIKQLAAPPLDRPDATRTLQIGLAALGWTPGPIDGIWGQKTRDALTALVQAEGAPRAAYVPSGAFAPHAPRPALPPGHVNTIRQGSAGHPVTAFMLHTSATSSTWWRGKSNDAMFAEIKSWHTMPTSRGGRGWRDIGYHYVIFPDGGWLRGRADTTIGAGAVGFNAGWLHACMVPVHVIERMGKPADFYTPETLNTARELLKDAARRTQIKRVAGHNEVANKLCPGFIVNQADWLPA